MRLFHDKKGTGPIGAIMLFIMFIIVYFVWLSSWLSEVGTYYITTTGAVGVEAFFYANLNLWVIIIMLLGCLGWAYFGGQQ